MDERCEFLDMCGFFTNFRSNTEVVRRGWVRTFCERRQNTENCERLKAWKQTGKLPADNVAPNGRVIGG